MNQIILLFTFCVVLSFSSACRPDGEKYCKSHQECCSGFCSKWNNAAAKYGVCQPRLFSQSTQSANTNNMMTTDCKKNMDRTCTENSECCSNYCQKSQQSLSQGVCMHSSSNNQFKQYNVENRGRHPYIKNGIIDSHYGNKNRGWCKPDGDNSCQNNQECCSSFCDTNNGAVAFGTCRSSWSTMNCRSNFDICQNNLDCCSKFCDNGTCR